MMRVLPFWRGVSLPHDGAAHLPLGVTPIQHSRSSACQSMHSNPASESRSSVSSTSFESDGGTTMLVGSWFPVA